MSKYPGSPERIRELLQETLASAEGDAQTTRLLRELIVEFEQTPLGKLDPGEPIFYLRGQDVLFPATVIDYSRRMRGLVGEDAQLLDLHDLAVEAIRWQASNRAKVAD